MARKSKVGSGSHGLSEREELVLRYIVQNYILTANPVGSSYLSRRLEEELISAATIRNTMADLERKGLISHPHTSAGRVPTDLGYRFYVDSLMLGERLGESLDATVRNTIRQNLDSAQPQPQLLRDASRLIAAVSDQLGIVTAPEILDALLERLEIVPLSSTRLLVVLSIQANLIRTVTLEVQQVSSRERLFEIVQLLNERLAGLSLREIHRSCHERLRDLTSGEETEGVIDLLLEQSNTIFAEGTYIDRLQIARGERIFSQPEFADPEQMRGIVELIENHEVVIHLIDNAQESQDVTITIGGEHIDERMHNYTSILARYHAGASWGTIGVIGPKRMNYSRMVTVVEFIARAISDNFGGR